VCSTVTLRGIYTSDIKYAANTLPKGMALKVTSRDKSWFDDYAWLSVGGEGID
jgi:hypothetical protein